MVLTTIVYTKYRSPDVHQLLEISKPVPEDDEVVRKISFSYCKNSPRDKRVCIKVNWPLLTARRTALKDNIKLIIGLANKIEDLTYLKDLRKQEN